MKVAWAKSKVKKTMTLEQMKLEYPEVYEATFNQWLEQNHSITEEVVEYSKNSLEEMVNNLKVSNLDWSTEIPVVSFEMGLVNSNIGKFKKLSRRARDAQETIDALRGAGYKKVAYDGRTLLSDKKQVTVPTKVWEPLVSFIRQAFWNIYIAAYENELSDLEDEFLDENGDSEYAI